MSDTIKNVRLKDKTGNILHPEITVDTELNSTSENPVQNKVINAKLDEVFQSVSNGKSLLETAITDKGSSVSKAGNVATFEELKTGIAGISTGTGLNIFAQTEEPTTKTGLWFKTSNEYQDVLEENSAAFTKMKDAPCDISSSGKIASVDNNIYIYGGGGYSNKKIAYKYDTTTDTYTKLTDIPYEFDTSGGVVISVGNNIYIYGSGDYSNIKIAYKYDTTTDTYTKLTDTLANTYNTSLAKVNTDIYFMGGSAGDENIKTAYKYDTTTDTYTKLTDIPYEFVYGTALSIDDNIYMVGGYNYPNYYNFIYKYDIAESTYTKISDNMPCNCAYNMAIALNGNIYIFENKGFRVYKYDIINNTYTQLTNSPYTLNENGITSVNNNIYLLGGYTARNSNVKMELLQSLKNNSIIFLEPNNPYVYNAKLINTGYDGIDIKKFFNVIMTDENGNNANVEVYIGNGTEWTKIS